MWLHQHYKIVPDLMTFGKRSQVAGIFAKPEYRPDFPSMIFGTWMGDPLRLELTLAINQTINRDNLLVKVTDTGNYLF